MTKNVNLAKILDQDDIFAGSITVGNSTVNVLANSVIVKLANSTVNTGIAVPTSAQYAGSYYLHANGTWQLVSAGATPGGANTQVQFNDSTALGGTAGFTFDKATNNAVIANTLTVGSATINSSNYSQTANNALNLGGTAAASYQLNSTLAANVATLNANNATWHGTSIFANSTGAYPTSNSVGAVLGNTISRVIITGNSATFSSTLAATDTTITGFVNATTVVNSASHTVGTTFVANTLGVYHTTLVNSALFTTTGVVINTTAVVPTSNTILLGNSIGRFVLSANSADIGPNFVANTLGAYHTAVMNAASHTTTGITANATGIYPSSNTVGSALGLTAQRWVLFANTIDVSGAAILSSTLASGNLTVTGFVNATVSVNSALLAVGALFTANSTLVNAAAINITGAVNTATFNSTGATAVGTTLSAGNTTITGFANASVSVNSALVTVGTAFIANTLGAYHTGTMNAAVFTTTGFRANVTHVVPTSNSSGQNFGNTISRWQIFANTIDITTSITANGALGGAAQTLTSNSTGGVYWATGGGGTPGGANTQVQFNDSGAFNGTAGFTFDKATNNAVIANTFSVGANVVVNTTSIIVGNSTTNTLIGNNTVDIGNSTVNTYANSTFLRVINSTANVSIIPGQILINTANVQPAIYEYQHMAYGGI